jgi:hypothetical protein
MRSVPIALRVLGAVSGALLLTPPGVAYAEEGGQVKATFHPATVKPGGEVELRVPGCTGDRGSATSQAFVLDAELSGRAGAKSSLSGETTVRSGVDPGTYPISVSCDGHDYRGVGSFQVAMPKPEPSRLLGQGGQEHQQTGKQDEDEKRDEDKKRDQGHEKQDEDKKRDQGHEKQDEDKKRDQGHEKQDEDKKRDQGHEKQDEDKKHDQGQDGEDDEQDSLQDLDTDETPVAPVRAGGGGAATALASEDARSAETQGPGTPHTVIGLVLAAVAAVAVAFRSARRRRAGTTDED